MKTACAVQECRRESRRRGWCDMHYRRWLHNGDVATVRPGGYAPAPVADRFWPKVNKTGTCWLWTGATYPNGYGAFGVASKVRLAHRVAYELAVGPIPAGMVLDHLCYTRLCYTRLCVRTDHLEPVTQKENLRRAREHGLWGQS